MKKRSSALSAERIRAYLPENAPRIFVYDEISSTNDAAKEYAESGGSFAVFIADRQTKGRGRLGRSFASPAGAGIYMSLLYRPSHSACDGVLLTTAAAVATCLAIEDTAGISPEIKWVNDLKLCGKKVCGILAEGRIDPVSGGFDYAVIGIGVNVYSASMPPEVEAIATALSAHTDREIDRNELCARMIVRLLESLALARGMLMDAYRARCPLVGRAVTVHRGEEKISATVLGIEDSGELLILADGKRMLLSSGEISIREV